MQGAVHKLPAHISPETCLEVEDFLRELGLLAFGVEVSVPTSYWYTNLRVPHGVNFTTICGISTVDDLLRQSFHLQTKLKRFVELYQDDFHLIVAKVLEEVKVAYMMPYFRQRRYMLAVCDVASNVPDRQHLGNEFTMIELAEFLTDKKFPNYDSGRPVVSLFPYILSSDNVFAKASPMSPCNSLLNVTSEKFYFFLHGMENPHEYFAAVLWVEYPEETILGCFMDNAHYFLPSGCNPPGFPVDRTCDDGFSVSYGLEFALWRLHKNIVDKLIPSIENALADPMACSEQMHKVFQDKIINSRKYPNWSDRRGQEAADAADAAAVDAAAADAAAADAAADEETD